MPALQRIFVELLALIFCLAILELPLFANTTISIKDLDLPPSFPMDSEYWTIRSVEKKDDAPGFYSFQVASRHAEYEVQGLVPLKKLLHEIEVIERINRNGGGGFMEGATDSAAATGEGFVNLAAHPVHSVKRMGHAAAKLGSKISGMFRKKEEGEESSRNEKIIGASEREIANKFGVDVYTDNPNLKNLLTETARARAGGKGAATVMKFLIPVAGFVSAAVTTSGVNRAADQWVNDKDRSDLYQMNESALKGLEIDKKISDSLLGGLYLSPREVTYLRYYLETLKELQGFQGIAEKAAQAGSVPEARSVLYAAQAAADAFTAGELKKSNFESLEVYDEGLALVGPERVVFITPFDYLELSSLGDRVMNGLMSARKKSNPYTVEIWNAGKIDRLFSAMALVKGIRTRSWALVL